MERLKFDAEKVKAGDIVGKFSDEEIKVFHAVMCRRSAIKKVITNLIKQLAESEAESAMIWWKKTSYGDDRKLGKRDLMLVGDPDTGDIRVEYMSLVSHETALFPLS